MPTGYGFLKKGNPFMTALCRKETHAAKKTLYVVTKCGKQEGLRAPIRVLRHVRSEEKKTREKRRGAVQRRDAATEDAFEAATLKLFPKIPKQDLTTILKRTLRKRSGRVGRTGKLDLDKKAYLAVQAHARHCHTDYDKLLKQASQGRDAARRAIRDKVSRLLIEWGGDPTTVASGGNLGHKNPKREPRKSLAVRTHQARRRRASFTKPVLVRHKHMPALKQLSKQSRAPKENEARPQPQPQPQPDVIDLTQDSDEPEESGSTSQAFSEGECQDAGDGSYELSDVVDSDGDYEVDSDWLPE
ncbi:uncharacterized protein Triagg1_9508 [Trichoderma aggressivum f. europaeum]|uniref:DUF2293 domain-containing protein n=1 Tax=Trichoderma aggressivum f. europaeum TaxID=173218 RepID=A0AAE1IYM8_9HYPO|nr:hypothetical protein Triagg1_9508 [Trichoderma aggressivum f. europaeum]